MKTKHRIALASMAYRGASLLRRVGGKNDHVHAERGGIRWKLDLGEGIDFAIYLLGSFESRTVRFYSSRIRSGDVVLDIGANVGAHTLPFLKCVKTEGHVFAFEPTGFAFEKLRANLALNPALATNVTAEQIFLVAHRAEAPAKELYASWPLGSETDVHPEHLGRNVSTAGARAETLDDYLARVGAPRVNWIKLDVDGYELSVLAGARETLRRHRPKLIMEFAPYLATETGSGFEPLVELLREFGYEATAIPSGHAIALSAADIRAKVPKGNSMNVFLEIRR